MLNPVSLESVDYLVIGHVAHDLTPEGPRLGGTVAYSALTARALGLQVGVVTASGRETSLEALNGIQVVSLESPQSTTYENIYTEHGCVLYWNGDRRRFRAPAVHEVDATGAGDVFAAAFFIRLLKTRDPWEAARFATLIASRSVTRVGLAGIPTPQEIEESLMEVLQ